MNSRSTWCDYAGRWVPRPFDSLPIQSLLQREFRVLKIVGYIQFPASSLNTMENGSSSEGKDPSAFLGEIIGAPVIVKLNSGVVYKGNTEGCLRKLFGSNTITRWAAVGWWLHEHCPGKDRGVREWEASTQLWRCLRAGEQRFVWYFSSCWYIHIWLTFCLVLYISASWRTIGNVACVPDIPSSLRSSDTNTWDWISFTFLIPDQILLPILNILELDLAFPNSSHASWHLILLEFGLLLRRNYHYEYELSCPELLFTSVKTQFERPFDVAYIESEYWMVSWIVSFFSWVTSETSALIRLHSLPRQFLSLALLECMTL